MVNSQTDEAFARYLLQMRSASETQVAAARVEQARLAQRGDAPPLAEVLVRQGVITSEIRENVEKLIGVRAAPPAVNSFGQYALTKKLGEGGMGTVYLAKDTVSGRLVALKVLPKRYSSDTNVLTRFKREAKATAKLNHENIVAAYTTGEENGYHYFVMEYCEGEPLDRKLKRKGFLPWDRSINIALQTAQGLKHAHEQGIIHRDIKPANLCILTNGVVKILDMGLSKNLDGDNSNFNTQSGAILGTPHYLSPEQATGDKSIDGRTDIYSLGATLYNMVTGQTPFQGSSSAIIMMKHINEQLPNPQDIREDIPDGVVTVIRKMMAKAPEDRYRDCGELITDLDLLLQGKMPAFAPIDEYKSSVALPKHARRVAGTAGVKVPAGALPRRQPTAAVSVKPDSARGNKTPVPPSAPPKQRGLLYAGAGFAVTAIVAGCIYAFSGGKPNNSEGDPAANPNPAPAPVAQTTPAVSAPLNANAPVKPNANAEQAAFIKAVKESDPDVQIKKVLARLMALNPGFDGTARNRIANNRVEELQIASFALQDISPLAALTELRMLNVEGVRDGNDIQHNRITDLSPLEKLPLMRLSLQYSSVSDLKPLRNMALTQLNLRFSPVFDLSPLKGLPLTWLDCEGTKVASVEPLRGMPLIFLNLHSCPVESIAPLGGMPLATLRLQGSRVSDLAPLAKMKINFLELPVTIADFSALKDIEIASLSFPIRSADDAEKLMQFAPLARINNMTHDELAKKYEQRPPPPIANPPPVDTAKVPPPPVVPPPATTTPPAIVSEAHAPANSYVSFDIGLACNAEFISTMSHYYDVDADFYPWFNWEPTARLKALGKKETGLPDDGRIEIPEEKGNFFQLEMTAPCNALKLTAPSGTQPRALTFVLPQNQTARYARLAILHAANPGYGKLRVRLRYDTGAPEEQLITVADWRTPNNVLPAEHLNQAFIFFHPYFKQNFYMSANVLRIDSKRTLRSVTLAMDEVDKARSVEQTFHAGVFAVSGLPAAAIGDPPPPEADKPRPAADVDESWVKSVQGLSAKEQVKAVADKLVELNPGFGGQYTWKEELNQVAELSIQSDALENIAPVRALARLHKLECGGIANVEKGGRFNRLSDLSPLKKLNLLSRLNVSLTSVEDLSQIKGLALTDLDISDTFVRDLAPLKGAPLRVLNCARTDVSSLAPVSGARLDKLNVSGCPITELPTLKSLRELNLSHTRVASLNALASGSLETLDMTCSRIGADDAAKLAALPIKTLTADDDFINENAQTLKNSKALNSVNGLSTAEFRFKYPDALVHENFEHLDLQRLPPLWSISDPKAVTIVERPGHGKVLSISNKADVAGSPCLEIQIDPAKLKGKTVALSVLAFCPGGYTMVNATDKPILYMHAKLAGNKAYESPIAVLEWNISNADWQLLKTSFAMPAGAQSATVSLKVQRIPAEVLFDDLKIEVLPSQPPPPKK